MASALQNDAFLYYGLGDDVHQKVNMIQSGKSYPGDHTFKNDSKASGKAVYTETQTGTPEGDMSQTVTLTPEGLYLDGMSPFTLKKTHVLLLPAKLTPGTSWTMDLDVDANNRSLEAKYTCRVVGFKTLSTKAGPVTALYVVGTGIGKADSQPLKTNDEWWYVKGKGAVKSLETVTAGSQTTKSETDITEP